MADIIKWKQPKPGEAIEQITITFDEKERDALLSSFRWYADEYKNGNVIDRLIAGHTPEQVEQFTQLLEQRLKDKPAPITITFDKDEWSDFMLMMCFAMMHVLPPAWKIEIDLLENMHDFLEEFEEKEAGIRYAV